MTPEAIRVILLGAVVLTAAATDLWWRKVPNLLTIPTISLGLVLNGIWGGQEGLLSAASGVALALALFLLSVSCGGGMGGGDVKLLAAVGGFGGARFLLTVFCVAVFVGGVMALAIAARERRLLDVSKRCLVWCACRVGSQAPIPLASAEGARVPYAVAIAAGVLVCLVWPGSGGT